MPAGSLAALAVVLAALAVVVVAGARNTIVRVPSGSPTSTVPTTPVGPHHGHHTRTHHRATLTAGHATSRDTGDGAEQTSGLSPATSPTTTSTTTTTTTTTSTTTTTTLPPVPSPERRNGTFRHGTTVVNVALSDAVRTVAVEVPAGVRVTLTVSCVGVEHGSSTSTTWASVRLGAVASSCTATIVVPAATPEPAAWFLTAT